KAEERLWTMQIAISLDGKWIAQGMPGETLLWEVAGRKLRHRFPRAGPWVAFAADSRSLFTAGALVLRWDVDSGKLMYADTREDGHVGPVVSLAFTPDGRSLATSGFDTTLRIWDLAKQTHRVLHSDGADNGARVLGKRGSRWGVPAVPIAVTADGRQILSDVAVGTLALTDIATGKEVRRFQFSG